MQIGCCAPIDKYEMVKEGGFDFVEFPAWQVEPLSEEEMAALLDRMKKTGLPCIRLNSYCKGIPAIVGDACDDAKTAEYAEKLMKNAAALGVQCIGVGAPPARRLPEGYNRELADRQCEQFLRISGEVAARYGITLLVESIQSACCNYINTLAEAWDMVRRVDMDSVGLMADLYHMQTEGESWDILPDYAPYIRHMHVSTILEGTARGLYTEADQADSDKALAAITGCGYSGPVCIEPDAAVLTLPAIETCVKVMRRSAGEL